MNTIKRSFIKFFMGLLLGIILVSPAQADEPEWTWQDLPVDSGLADIWAASSDDVFVAGSNGTILH